MKFRTEIEPIRPQFAIDHSDRIVMLGSCFTDSVGQLLERDGFSVVRNPGGPLYNPESVARVIERRTLPAASDLYRHEGMFHFLDYAARYSSASEEDLLAAAGHTAGVIADSLAEASVVIITFGSARVYRFLPGGYVAGNCHRLPALLFSEENLTVEQITERWESIIKSLKAKVILTVSPIRYTAHGLAANSLSKAVLRVAVDRLCSLCPDVEYFPAYEILNDDLRDYRFYASDLKHPSEMAVDYVYEHFSEAFFSPGTQARAAQCRREAARTRHIDKTIL